MLDKDLLKYLGEKRYFLVFIVIFNVFGLALNVLVTASLVLATSYFIELKWMNGIYATLATLLFGLLKIVATLVTNKLSNLLADYVTKKLRSETYEKYLALEGKTPFTTSEMAQLSTEGIEQLRLYYSTYIPSFFYAMIAPLLLFFLILFIDLPKTWPVALLYIACVPLIPISIISVSKFAKKIFNKYWDKYIGLGNSFLDNTKGMKELKIFKYDEAKQKQMEGESEGFRKITMKVLVMQLASVTIMDLVAFGGAGIGIAISLSQMLNHGLDIYITIFLILIGAEFFLPMRALGSAFHVAMNGATAGKKIMKLLNLPVKENGKEELTSINKVSMKNLSFGYEDNMILQNINFEFKKGLYSLVGLSGSGKSTIAKLFSQVIDPKAGEIEINDKDITSYTLKSFYEKVAYISANTYIFHQSIRESFKFYNPSIDEETMQKLLKKVKLEHLSLDYVVQEDSTNLSGGEKQRLALALYLSKEFDFYIFDEVTSNIDIESEEIILSIIKEISKEKIVLMISHRLKSTAISNKIYYLDNGEIVVSGEYEELLASDNKFKDLYETQNRLEVVA